jgi:Transglutaminase-like superfamily
VTVAIRKLPWKIALAAEVVTIYVRVRWLLWRTSLPSTIEALRSERCGNPPADPFTRFLISQRMTRAVVRTLPLIPAESRCLMRSLVLLGLLARRDIDATLFIGVKEGPAFGAHAWIESEGRILLSAQDDVYSPLAGL